MTITELMARLDALRAEYGDLEVAGISAIGDYGTPVVEVEDLSWLVDSDDYGPRNVCVVSGRDRLK